MLIEHGYSARYEGRRAALEGQPSQNHSEACRKRILDSIGGKNAPEVEAQRKRFDAFVDKAAAKEDFEELGNTVREKKRMRSDEIHAPDTTSEADIPGDSNNTGTSSSSSSNVAQNPRGAKRVSENDGRADLDEAQIEMAKRAAESGLEIMRKRGEERMETTTTEREVRARIPEARGQKRISENDGRDDLDEKDSEFATKNTRMGQVHISKSAAR